MTSHLLTAAAFEQAAECLRAIAHPSRLCIIQLILDERCTVGEIATRCAVAPNVASEHLRLLERCNLLQREKDGRKVYYLVDEPLLAKLMDCIAEKFGKGGDGGPA